jgi:hypothetical protein
MKLSQKTLDAMAAKSAAKNKRKSSARRGRAIKTNASVGSACSIIEKSFGLPEGSVRLLLPTKKHAQRDKMIGKLLSDWKY